MRRDEVFGSREREALLALIELWEVGTGEPISTEALAQRLGWPTDAVWDPMNKCRQMRLVWRSTPNRAVVDGWIPLALAGNVPEALPYPVPKTAMGISKQQSARAREREPD